MRICLNDGWKFFIDYENENFVSVRLPHTELLNSLSSINIKYNRFIYRNEFSYSDDFKNRRIFFYCHLLENSEVYLNGKEVLLSDGHCELTKLIKKDLNVLEIRTSGYLNETAYLDIKEKNFISDVSFLQSYEEGNYILNCRLKYDGKFNGYESVSVSLYDKDNLEVFNTSFSALLKEYSFNVGKVREWSKNDPYLYTIEFSLNDSKYKDTVGFRHFTKQGDSLRFNEKAFLGKMMTYENIHPYVYNLCDKNLIEDDLKKVKELNVDIIRLDYADETLLGLCDRYGIMVACAESIKDHSSIVFDLKDNKLVSKDSKCVYDYSSFNEENFCLSLKKFRQSKSGIFDFGLFSDNDYTGSKGFLDFFRNRKQNAFNFSEQYKLFSDGSRYLINGDFSYLKLYYRNEYLGIVEPNELDTAVIDNIPELLFKKKYGQSDKKFAALMNVINDMCYYKADKTPLIARIHRIIFRMANKMSEQQLYRLYSEYQCMSITDDLKFELYKGDKLLKTIEKKKKDKIHYDIEVSKGELDETAAVRLICRNEDNEIISSADELVYASVKGRISLMSPSVCSFKNGVSTFYVRSNGLKGKATLTLKVLDEQFEAEFTVKKEKTAC